MAKKSLRRKLLLVSLPFVALVIAALVAEIVVRTSRPQPITAISRGFFTLDPPRRFRLTPSYRGRIANVVDFDTEVAISSLGLRGPEIGPKGPDTVRLLSLGDSFAFGYGVSEQDSYIGRLTESLRPRLPGIEGLNAGVPGYGVPDAVDWFKAYGLEVEPDLVLLSVYLGNDIMDATEKSRREGFSFLFPGAGPARGLVLWLYGHSHLFRLAVQNDFKGWRARLGLPEPKMVVAMREMAWSFTQESDLGQEGRRASRRSLAELKELADQHDFRLAVMIIPSRFMLEQPYREAVLRRLGLDPATHDPDAPRRFFVQTLAGLGIPTLDMTERVRAGLAAKQPLYFRFDPHWSAQGHRLAAEALQEFILQGGLLERPPTRVTPAEGQTAPALTRS